MGSNPRNGGQPHGKQDCLGRPATGRGRAVVLGILFSLVLNAQSLIELSRFGFDSPLLLTNWDEFHYLIHPYNVFFGLPRESVYRNDPDLKPAPGFEDRIIEPAGLLDYAIGAAAGTARIRPQALGLLLDLFAPLFAFIFYRRLFLRFQLGGLGAEALAAIFLTLPVGTVLLSVFQPALGAWGPSGRFVTASPGDIDGFPVLRSVYTQFSLIGFAWALERLLTVVQSETPRRTDWLWLGLSSGLLIYLYFFSWGAFAALSAFALTIYAAANRRGFSWFRGSVAAFASHLLIAAPGLIILFRHDTPVVSDAAIGGYWFVPLEIIPWLIAASVLITRLSSQRKLPLILFAAALLSYPLLMNLQPLSAKGLAPYRFANLYLFPLAGITALISVFQFLESRPNTARLLPAAFLVLGLTALIVPAGLAIGQNSSLSWTRGWIPLVQHIRQNLSPDATIAVISEVPPFEQTPGKSVTSPFPNILSYLTGRPVLHQEWVVRYAVPGREDLERELLDGWLFSGKIQYLRPCPGGVVDLPGDLFSSTGAYRALRRRQICLDNPDLISSFTPCAGLTKYRPDYILIDHNLVAELSPAVAKYSRVDYTDLQAKLELLKLDNDGLSKQACAATGS